MPSHSKLEGPRPRAFGGGVKASVEGKGLGGVGSSRQLLSPEKLDPGP